MKKYELMALPYAPDALEPVIKINGNSPAEITETAEIVFPNTD